MKITRRSEKLRQAVRTRQGEIAKLNSQLTGARRCKDYSSEQKILHKIQEHENFLAVDLASLKEMEESHAKNEAVVKRRLEQMHNPTVQESLG